jgi:hypothetical protein
MALKYFGFKGQSFASPFQYMTETILAQYAVVNIKPDAVILSQASRDASPCQLKAGQSGRDAFFISDQNSSEWVELK